MYLIINPKIVSASTKASEARRICVAFRHESIEIAKMARYGVNIQHLAPAEDHILDTRSGAHAIGC